MKGKLRITLSLALALLLALCLLTACGDTGSDAFSPPAETPAAIKQATAVETSPTTTA